jgi:hypothetical protein
VTIVHEPTPPGADDRAADLVLARLHLRLGSLGLARAELETLAGRNALDDDGIRDLAEARWRTGDLPGAGEAAAAYLDLQPDDLLSLVICAELQSHLGRPAEARRLAARALPQSDGSIDEIFAGMPRGPVWPVEPGAPIEPAGTLFADLGTPLPLAPGAAVERSGEPTVDLPAEMASSAPGLWEHHLETTAPVLPDPGELLARARSALRADRPGQASASLALALRAEPSLAPAVLDLIAGRTEPVLALVRGDAHRIVGHEAEALRDYVAAVAAIGLERRSDDRRLDRREPGPDVETPPLAEAHVPMSTPDSVTTPSSAAPTADADWPRDSDTTADAEPLTDPEETT